MKAAIAIVVALSTACSSPPPVEHVSFGPLDVSVPAGWTAVGTPDKATMTWSPAENPKRETLRLTRTRPLPALTNAGPAAIERLLTEVQKLLPEGNFGVPTHFTTESGLSGARIEGSFVPIGQRRTYRRVHAVVVDGSADNALVHIIYTAEIPDREPMQIVLDSIRRKDA